MQFSKKKLQAYAYNSNTTSFKKGSLSKYTSYSNLIKSQDNLLEKQKLKEENWKLRNMSASLTEENKKLKEKINKRFNLLDQNNTKQFHVVNYNSNIEKVKEDIAKARDELNSISAENTNLVKKLSKQVNKKIIIDQSPPQPPELLKVRSDSRKHAELSNEKKIISDLNLEISELTVNLQSLAAKNSSYKDQIAKYKILIEKPKNSHFRICKETSIGVFPQVQSLNVAKKPNVEESSSDCSEL